MGLFSSPESRARKKAAKAEQKKQNFKQWKIYYGLDNLSPELDKQIYRIFALNDNLDFGALINTLTSNDSGELRNIAQEGREIASQNFVIMKQNDQLIKQNQEIIDLLKDKN